MLFLGYKSQKDFFLKSMFRSMGLTTVSPGDILTPRSEEYSRQTKRTERLRKYLERTALGRSAEPREIAQRIALYLDPQTGTCSSGDTILMGGGYLSRF